MKKQIKKVGSSIGITFTAEEKKVYGFKKGQIIELEPVIISQVSSSQTKKEV